jgi:1,4-alpha-glucan branching enzyme
MTKNSFGVWNVTVPAKNGAAAIPHDSKIKVNTSTLHVNRTLH